MCTSNSKKWPDMTRLDQQYKQEIKRNNSVQGERTV